MVYLVIFAMLTSGGYFTGTGAGIESITTDGFGESSVEFKLQLLVCTCTSKHRCEVKTNRKTAFVETYKLSKRILYPPEAAKIHLAEDYKLECTARRKNEQ